MPDFDQETVAPVAAPVLDTASIEQVSFIVREDNVTFVELRYSGSNAADPTVRAETVVLRRYATRMQFLTDFRAGPKAAVKAWLVAQTNESP